MKKQFLAIVTMLTIISTLVSCADHDLLGGRNAASTGEIETAAKGGRSETEADTSTDSEQTEAETNPATEKIHPIRIYEDNQHIHGSLHYYDDDTMTIYDVYEGNLIEHMIMDIKTFSGDGVRIFSGDEEVFEGELREGMTVQIYHDDVLFGEYVIAELRTSVSS